MDTITQDHNQNQHEDEGRPEQQLSETGAEPQQHSEESKDEEGEDDVKSSSDEFQDVDFDEDNLTSNPTADSLTSSDTATTLTADSAAAATATAHTPPLLQEESLREQEDISPKSQARPLTEDAPTSHTTPRTSVHASTALTPQARDSATPTADSQTDTTPQPPAASSTAEHPVSRLSVDSKENSTSSSSRPASAAASPSAPRRSFWGLLKTATTPEPGQQDSASASTPASETAPASSPLPRLSIGASAINPDTYIGGASASGARDSIASSSGSTGPRSSLAPSFFGLPPASPSPSSPNFPASGSTPEPTPSSSRKPPAFSPFASIMSNLRTRTSNVSAIGFGSIGGAGGSSSSNNHDGDDLDGRSRLPRRDLDEDKLAEDVMRFAEARHVLRTETDVEELRRLGLRLEEAWREKLAEVGILRTKLESAQDTVGDLEDENANLRKQLGLLSEQIAARETDLEDFQKLTIGQIEAQRALWEEEGREERENLEFNLAQSKRETLEQKSINAQLRLVILGTLQGRLDGLTDWLGRQNDGEAKKARRRMSTQIGKRRESLKSMIMSMDQTIAAAGVPEEGGGGGGGGGSTPLMRHQTFAAEEGENPTGRPSSSAMDEVSSTTSGKAPGGSWSPRQSDGDRTEDDGEDEAEDEEEEEVDHLFDIEDVLFNLPTSPSVSGRPATMLFNEPLNLDQLKKMGFFREDSNEAGAGAGDVEDAKSGAAGFLSPSSSFEKKGGLSPNSTRPSSSSSPFFAFGSSSKDAPPPPTAAAAVATTTSPVQDLGLTTATLSNQRLLVLIEKLQADRALAEAARAENVLLQKRIEEESRRAHELEEELVQTKVRLEQTEAAVSDLFGGQQEDDDDDEAAEAEEEGVDAERGGGEVNHGDSERNGSNRVGGRTSGFGGSEAAAATATAARGQQGLGLVTGSA